MSNKRRVLIALHHRNALSLPPERERLGHAAYHWVILIEPKFSRGANANAYDVTDAPGIDPNNRVNQNPENDWRFLAQCGVNPYKDSRFIGRVMIGKLPNNVKDSQVESILRGVEVPIKNAVPGQNCVTWTMAAIQALQSNGFVEKFDLDTFAGRVL